MLSIFEETIFRCRFWVFPLFPFVNFPQVGGALAAFMGSVLALRVQQCLCFFVSMILCFFVICIFSIYSDPFHREGDWAKVKPLVAAEGSSSLAVQVGATKVQLRCNQGAAKCCVFLAFLQPCLVRSFFDMVEAEWFVSWSQMLLSIFDQLCWHARRGCGQPTLCEGSRRKEGEQEGRQVSSQGFQIFEITDLKEF